MDWLHTAQAVQELPYVPDANTDGCLTMMSSADLRHGSLAAP